MGLNSNMKGFMHETHSKKSDKWIQSAVNPKNKGLLRKELKVPEGKKIPEKKLEKATHSKNLTLKKRAVLAETLKNIKKKK